MADIFERASRGALRFESAVGDLTTEQLWRLPLTERGDKPDLDKLARAVNSELKSLDEGSFVKLKPDPRKTDLELKLDILKHIIDYKIGLQDAAVKAAEARARRERLLAALAKKEEADLAGLSRAEIEAEIAKIGD